VADIIAAIVAPVDDCSIEMMLARLVAAGAAAFGEADAARGRDLALFTFRGASRVATLVFDLGFVMGDPLR
jgi:hypothetical protein